MYHYGRSLRRSHVVVIGVSLVLAFLLAGCGGGNLCCASDTGGTDVNIYGPAHGSPPPADQGGGTGGAK